MPLKKKNQKNTFKTQFWSKQQAWGICYNVYCRLSTADVYCLLPTAYCLLSTVDCGLLLPTAYCLLRTAYCVLPTAYCLFSFFTFSFFSHFFTFLLSTVWWSWLTDWLTYWLIDWERDWKLTVPYHLRLHHWDWDCDWIDWIDWSDHHRLDHWLD